MALSTMNFKHRNSILSFLVIFSLLFATYIIADNSFAEAGWRRRDGGDEGTTPSEEETTTQPEDVEEDAEDQKDKAKEKNDSKINSDKIGKGTLSGILGLTGGIGLNSAADRILNNKGKKKQRRNGQTPSWPSGQTLVASTGLVHPGDAGWKNLPPETQDMLYNRVTSGYTGKTANPQDYVPEAVDWALNDGIPLQELFSDPQKLQNYVNREIALRASRKAFFKQRTAEWLARIHNKQARAQAAKFMKGADVIWTKGDVDHKTAVKKFNDLYKKAPQGKRAAMVKEFIKNWSKSGSTRAQKQTRKQSKSWSDMTSKQRLKLLQDKGSGSTKPSSRSRTRLKRSRR